jgi:hypothetical protein
MTFDKTQQSLVVAVRRSAEIEQQRLAALETAPPGGTQPPPSDPRWLDRRHDAESAWRSAREAVQMAEAQLATAQARLESSRARIAADKVRFCSNPGDVTALAQTASRAERPGRKRLEIDHGKPITEILA